MVHVRNQNANIEPVFFSYPAVREMDLIIEGVVAGNEPVYDFVASDGFGHKFWVIDDPEVQQRITKILPESRRFMWRTDTIVPPPLHGSGRRK